MSFPINPTPEYFEFQEMTSGLSEMERNWQHLLEVILENSSVEEILNFALRLKEIPHYSLQEQRARDFIRTGATHRRVFDSGGRYGCSGFHWEEHSEDPVPLLELPKGLIQKGSNSWKITI